ncbi:hypothetical protein SPH9361_04901 [Sphingobium sp. CECT 9361]|nr:hypothetical protein SPH9361_04901 [Sphingobium sp. CECT 9361]
MRRSTRTRLMTRQKLIDATRRIMMNRNPEAATIADITEEADVGFGSFYNHFSSKQDILDAIYDSCSADFVAVARDMISDESDVTRNISYLLRLVLCRSRADHLWARCMAKELVASDTYSSDFSRLFRTQFSVGKQLGQIHFLNVERALRMVFACLHGAIQDILAHSRDQSFEDECIELSLRIIGISVMQAEVLASTPLPNQFALVANEQSCQNSSGMTDDQGGIRL